MRRWVWRWLRPWWRAGVATLGLVLALGVSAAGSGPHGVAANGFDPFEIVDFSVTMSPAGAPAGTPVALTFAVTTNGHQDVLTFRVPPNPSDVTDLNFGPVRRLGEGEGDGFNIAPLTLQTGGWVELPGVLFLDAFEVGAVRDECDCDEVGELYTDTLTWSGFTSPGPGVYTFSATSRLLFDGLPFTATSDLVIAEPPSGDDFDLDDDGLPDDLEELFGTDPTNPDSDGDGVPDGEELFINHTDPTDPLNGLHPQGCPAPGTFAPPLTGSRQLTLFGGGSVAELAGLLNSAGLGAATFGLPDGGMTTILPVDGEFQVDSFFDVFFEIEVGPSNPAGREVPPCTIALLE